jgi:tripartite motif-containing protein 71
LLFWAFRAGSSVSAGGARLIYITDLLSHRIQKVDTNGKYVGQVGTERAGTDQFSNPCAISTGKKGELWVADGTHVREFDEDGKYLKQVEVSGCEGFAIDGDGNIWVIGGGLEKRSDTGSDCRTIVPEAERDTCCCPRLMR